MARMRYTILGRSGLRVSELCLGTMTFGEDWGFGAPPAECRRQWDAFVAAGGNFIDTANLYTNGSSEKIVGELIAADRERVVLATKYALMTRPGDPNSAGSHRKNLVQAVEASLRRLGTPYIDLLWLHAWDATTPPVEVMRALDDLVRTGKVLHVGASDTPAWVVAQCNTIAELRGWTPFVSIQIEYSLIERTVERELVPMARAYDLPICAWGAIGGGVLSGKYSRGGDTRPADSRRVDGNQRRINERSLAVARTVDAIADELDVPSTTVALAWVRAQGNVIPIVGARTTAQLADSLRSTELTLSPAQLARLDEVSRVPLGFPHDFMHLDHVRRNVWSDQLDRLDWIRRER
jgi:aryl-alcohol dehydrogenase-like predicted oxidoreductase